MKYNIILKYNPPREEFDESDITTWQKVFIIDKNECAEQLDFDLKVNELRQKYKMKKEYMSLMVDVTDSLTK